MPFAVCSDPVNYDGVHGYCYFIVLFFPFAFYDYYRISLTKSVLVTDIPSVPCHRAGMSVNVTARELE